MNIPPPKLLAEANDSYNYVPPIVYAMEEVRSKYYNGPLSPLLWVFTGTIYYAPLFSCMIASHSYGTILLIFTTILQAYMQDHLSIFFW